jgi:hypothetical protein
MTERVSFRCGRRLATLLLALALQALSPGRVNAGPADGRELSPAQQLAIARAFAPTLVFHPEELYFPISAVGSTPTEGWSARVDQYRALPRPDKLSRAALAYRVFPRSDDRQAEIIVEYWCYYVFNAYTIHGGFLPYRVSDDHPNDLERLYLVLTPATDAWRDDEPADEGWARRTFSVSSVVANAHNGSIPANRYDARGGTAIAAPLAVLVELGSHAMAADIDGDGRFKPGVDSTNVTKFPWGIRDDGATWRWYRPGFMDARDATATRLCGPVASPEADAASCPRYALYPANGLQQWFESLELSTREREDMVGRTRWAVRMFGDARVEDLMAPTDAANGHEFDKLLRRRRTDGTGFSVGFTTVDYAPALVLARRSFWEVPSPHAPDILAEVAVIVPKGRRALMETTVWGSYSVDAITNVMFGFGWFSEARSTSPTIGAEIRLGRFRVRPNWRLKDGGFDARITTIF